MFTNLKNRFKSNPMMFYAMSIAATWAGVGSLLVGIETAQTNGIIPFLLWALGNTFACIVFGILAPMIPKLRDVFKSKPLKLIVGMLCPFQIWLSMNGIKSIWEGTMVSGNVGMWIAYAFAILFIFVLFRFGMIRNVLTDRASWIAVYIVALVLAIAAIIHSKGNMVQLPIGADVRNVQSGLTKCLLLLPGPFLYPYFFEILDYNDKNEDGTRHINVQRTFAMGGMLFGGYLIFTFLLAWTSFSPVLNVIKAILVTLVAISTLSSFQYSIYLTFGKKIGLAINILCVVLWQALIPLGVMGAWTLMASIRIWIVLAALVISLVWALREKKAVMS